MSQISNMPNTVLISDNTEKRQDMLDEVTSVSSKYDLEINIQKAK